MNLRQAQLNTRIMCAVLLDTKGPEIRTGALKGGGPVTYESGSQVTLTPSTSTLGGCFRVYANGGQLTLGGECQGQWQAFSASASSNPLTVVDSNV